MDGFVTHVGQKLLDKGSILQPQQREIKKIKKK
jgi:hypothetical protein